MRALPSTFGPLFLLPFVVVACAGDNFMPDAPNGTAGSAGSTSTAGAAGAGSGTSSGKGGSVGGADAGNGTAGKGGTAGSGAGEGGDSGAAGDDAGQGGGDAGAGGDDGGGGQGNEGGSAGATSGGFAGKGGAGGSGTGGSAGNGGNAGASGVAGAGGKAGSTGSAGKAGASAGGGAAGAAGTAGAAGSAGGGVSGGAGSGGNGPPSCGGGSPACAADTYCDEDDHVCRSCGDLGRLQFGAAVSKLGPSGSRVLIDFPRVGIRDGLPVLSFKARGQENGQDDIGVRAVLPNGALGAPPYLDCCVNKGGFVGPGNAGPRHDSGALLLPPSMTGASFAAVSNHGDIESSDVPFFLIDSTREFNRTEAGGGRNPLDGSAVLHRRIHIAQWDADESDNDLPGYVGIKNAYGPVPALNSGIDDYSVAFAWGAPAGARRFYWMSLRAEGQTPELRTLVQGKAAADSVAVPVTLAGCSGPVSAADFRPWLTPDGTRLIINARCVGTDPWSLWITTPNAINGTLPPATRIEGVEGAAGADDTAGSLSPNKCELWFMRGGEVHSAPRR